MLRCNQYFNALFNLNWLVFNHHIELPHRNCLFSQQSFTNFLLQNNLITSWSFFILSPFQNIPSVPHQKSLWWYWFRTCANELFSCLQTGRWWSCFSQQNWQATYRVRRYIYHSFRYCKIYIPTINLSSPNSTNKSFPKHFPRPLRFRWNHAASSLPPISLLSKSKRRN